MTILARTRPAAYLLMTLGPALLALGLMEGRDYLGKGVFLVFGRAPLFYYILHLYLLHAGAIAFSAAYYGLEKYRSSPPEQLIFGLPVVYVATAIAVGALYPACRWFADLKRKRRDLWWLSYL